MSVNLCIDWGNTSVKAAVFVDDRLQESAQFAAADAPASLYNLIEQYKPVKAILCSVVSNTSDVEALLKDKVSNYLKMTDRTFLPVMNAYVTSESLGNDRVALAVGANAAYPDMNNLVISLGTCITYNFVQKTKTFRGGAISPGLQMRLKAMHQFTDKLPEVPVDGELLLLGYDTATCLRSGAVFGMAAEIDGIIDEYKSQYSDFNAVLTGGDAPFFAGRLKNKIFADPNLLMKGLNIILQHNVPIPR